MGDVVITGVGAVTPLGVGARVLHERWSAGASGIEDGEGRCGAYDPAEHLSKKEARRADRCTQLARVAAGEALADAGWDADAPPYDPELVGCIVGTGIGGIHTLEGAVHDLRDRGPVGVGPLSIPLMMSNAPAAAVALRHDLRGLTYGVVSACAAGAHAIGSAARAIQCGDATAVVCGGSEAAITPLSKTAFAAMDALSPSGVSRPFDARRDGFVMGEGAGVLVLEDGDAARERGARILATLRGYGATSDAHHLTAPHPEGQGAARAVRHALRDAGLEPADVDYVNAHGTSTPLNDRAETRALHEALGERATEVPVSSLKSAIGHLLGAAGAVEAVATVLALRDRVAPPTVGWAEREEGLDLDYVPGGSARPLALDDPERAPVGLSNSFGFGGHNAVLCLEAA
ncbi:beta-ketoacyl synthase [Conexibacter sp. SYSU D00693]|uniref:beta-ketoacyl-[acyl-carrier-protein] synthase family protein n=1 Tax=Conexibacter sp. SYSU D00693 TaxID=2812560 RepID=UPI00196B630A|nr:beta-ketoacyl-ACP synthase II [Conexibacter sp. SYSU D00693]